MAWWGGAVGWGGGLAVSWELDAALVAVALVFHDRWGGAVGCGGSWASS